MDLGSDETDGEGVAQYVTFQNGDRVYGLEITRVVEIRQWAPVSDLPNQPAYTRGVLNIRGEVIPVHDLRARFGGALTEATENHVVLIVALGDQKAGVLVDAVSDIVSVTGHDVRSVPDGAQHTDDGSIIGLVDRDATMIALVEPDRLFGSAQPIEA